VQLNSKRFPPQQWCRFRRHFGLALSPSFTLSSLAVVRLARAVEELCMDYARQRQAMVNSQIRVNDVTDPDIIAAMLELPREEFVPATCASFAYLDQDVPLQERSAGKLPRYLIAPIVLARLAQALSITEDDRVLDIGCTGGYSAALLSRLAASVVAVEEDPEFLAIAKKRLSLPDISNVKVVGGPLSGGAPKEGPYDAVLIEGSVELVPHAIIDSLKDRGRLIAVVGSGRAAKATLYLRSGKVISTWPVFDAALPCLPGFASPKEFVF
jgi:protein-L-isoaspartate(D-aspartate) O-methyltransferase